jgi:hypothetical protein
MDKTEKVFYRFKHDEKSLKLECVDLISKTYIEIGQKPDKETIVLNANLLYNDLINSYGGMTMDEIRFVFHKSIREGEESSVFLNVRTWNKWLRQHKQSEQLRRQNRQLTAWSLHEEKQKQISSVINNSKLIK